MINGLLGKKVGMTQLMNDDGTVVPVTVIQAGPCVVVQRKTVAQDGYDAAQLGFVEFVKGKRVTRPMAGHFKKADIAPVRLLREFEITGDEDVKAGDRFQVGMFATGESVHVTGTTKGRGFAGVIKRYHFGGGQATHGSMFHRAPGSIGQSAYPSRVWKGQKMPGHLGSRRVTVQSLGVERVDEEKNLLFVRGAVPGPNGGYVMIRKTG